MYGLKTIDTKNCYWFQMGGKKNNKCFQELLKKKLRLQKKINMVFKYQVFRTVTEHLHSDTRKDFCLHI